jgi:integrase
VGRYDRKRKQEVTCKTHPVCSRWYLHRFRATCATRWDKNRIPVRTIQKWLGHKKLETTQRYLGTAEIDDLRAQINRGF